MSIPEIPFVHQIRDWGPDDRIFDTLLLVGPLVIAVFVLVGRTSVTMGLAATYLVAFVTYVLYKCVH